VDPKEGGEQRAEGQGGEGQPVDGVALVQGQEVPVEMGRGRGEQHLRDDERLVQGEDRDDGRHPRPGADFAKALA
jgi:hypothetical protein